MKAFTAALICGLSAVTPHIRAHAAGVPVWTNHYSGPRNDFGIATAIAVDSSGNVFVMGQSPNNGGNADYATIKYSGVGVPLWTNRYNGFGTGNDYARAAAVDASGNVLVTGESFGKSSDYDYATIKYSGAGVPLWTNRYDGQENSYDYARAIAVDASGNVYVTGMSHGISSGYDYATVAYSGAGLPLWTAIYNGSGNNTDYATAIAVDGNGNVFVTGYVSSFDGRFEYATIKYSGAGVQLWVRLYNGPGSVNAANAIAVDGSGNVFVTGSSHGSGNENTADYATIKYSGAGVPLWTNRYNGPGAVHVANAIVVDKEGNVFVTGDSFGNGSDYDYATIKYSGTGVPLWTNRYNGSGNGSDRATAIAVDKGGNVFVTGRSFGSGSTNDYATVAYSGAGMPLWTNRYNGSANNGDIAGAVAVDWNGNVVVTGTSIGTNGLYNDYATIKYSAMPTLAQATVDNGQLQFQFNADANLTYAVEFRDAASATHWVTLTNLPAQPAATNFTFTTAITNPARLYRVRTP